jgi:TPR repeat protein
VKRRLLFVLALLCVPLACPLAAPAEQKSAGARKVTSAKAQAGVKNRANAKAKSQSRAKTKVAARSASTKSIPQTAVAVAQGAAPGQVAVRTESELQKELAAARAVLARDPDNAAANEALARTAVAATELLLTAEALGSATKTERLGAFLAREFPDVGSRLQKLARQGDPRARQALGVFYGRGIGQARDPQKSCAEFKAAAAQLPASAWHWAQCNLEAAPEEGWAQMERAALQGHAAAQEWIGRRCLGEFATAGKDFPCAREWLSQSASQGRPRSQTLYAYLLSSGQGGPVDASRALRLYRLAAEQGDADAQNNLGEIHETGRGVVKNPAEALLWYERAAERGFGPAQFNAGRLWAIGVGDRNDPAKARAWLVQAERNGIEQARQVLDWLDQQGSPAPTSAAREIDPQLPGSKIK